MDLKPGDPVISKAGRDKGKIFVVISIHEPDYVTISDGKLRKVEHPKLKKMKHVKRCGSPIMSINEKISTGEKINNSDIKKALAAAVLEDGDI